MINISFAADPLQWTHISGLTDRCYRLSTQYTSQMTGNDECRAHGGQLAVAESDYATLTGTTLTWSSNILPVF